MLEDLHRFLRGFLQRDASMRALWSDRPNCSHNVSQKVKRIRHLNSFWTKKSPGQLGLGVQKLTRSSLNGVSERDF